MRGRAGDFCRPPPRQARNSKTLAIHPSILPVSKVPEVKGVNITDYRKEGDRVIFRPTSMNRFTHLLLLGLATLPLAVRADTSIVFNEIMYHPATNETTMEWLELYNQMAVDVDMSGWSLDGSVHYNFGTNFVIHGGA